VLRNIALIAVAQQAVGYQLFIQHFYFAVQHRQGFSAGFTLFMFQ
jgi:hypothetical protein